MGKEQTFSIGRAADCDVVLADDSVSRRHAELRAAGPGRLVLVDCRSTHGTFVTQGGETRKITQEPLAPDTTVRFGEVALTVQQLMEAVRARHPSFDPGQLAGPGATPKRRTWAKGAKLVRCACGTVKPKGSACPECGK